MRRGASQASQSPCPSLLSPLPHPDPNPNQTLLFRTLQGQNFAYLQIKTIWSVLLRNFDFELLDPVPEPDYTSMVIMPQPARVRFTRKKLVA